MMYKTIPWNLIISHLKQETDQKEEAALKEWKNSDGNDVLYKELKSLWKEIQAEAGEYDPDVSYYWNKWKPGWGRSAMYIRSLSGNISLRWLPPPYY